MLNHNAESQNHWNDSDGNACGMSERVCNGIDCSF